MAERAIIQMTSEVTDAMIVLNVKTFMSIPAQKHVMVQAPTGRGPRTSPAMVVMKMERPAHAWLVRPKGRGTT